MENACVLVHHRHFLLLSFTILVLSSTTIPHRLNIKLIHRDSFFSPYYNPNATTLDRFRQAMKNSMARFAYIQIQARTKSTTDDDDNDVRGKVIPENGSALFLVNLSIGELPVPQLVALDTGSSLLWVQCLPFTNCLPQFGLIFDPSKSSTYSNLPCNSTYCDPFITQFIGCSSERVCTYFVEYMDGSKSIGNLATEKLTLVTSDEGTTNIPNVVFGCGHENNGFNEKLSGILGLGQDETSLVSQLGYETFSYCLGSIFDPQYNYNQLILGDGAKIEGYSTPMEMYNGHYYLNLEGIISVGEKRLDIEPETFRRSTSLGNGGGVIIDSGSTLTFLARGGFQALSAEVQKLMDGLLERVFDPMFLCYKGTVSRDLKGFPVVTFHFARGADLVLDITSMFRQYHDGEFCMAVIESDGVNNFTIIGIMAQQYYNIAYDLDAMELSFQRIDCELLQD